jgi:hypothetical protein
MSDRRPRHDRRVRSRRLPLALLLAVQLAAAAASAQLSGIGSQEWSQGPLAGVTETGDRFGQAVAVGDFDGDGYDDLAIGVPDEDVGSEADAGAVHVLYGGPTGLGEPRSQLLTLDDIGDVSEAGDRFGFSLAAGNLSVGHDETDDLVIGAPGKDLLADGEVRPDAGRVYSLLGAPGGFSGVARQYDQEMEVGPFPPLSAWENAEAGDFYGFAVAVLDGCWFPIDPYPCVVVGVPGEDLEGPFSTIVDAGLVTLIGMIGPNGPLPVDGELDDFHFHQDSTHDGVAVAGVAEEGDRCGWSLATGDFDDDGRVDLAVGCPLENEGALSDTGAVVEVTLDRGQDFDPVFLASAIFSQDGAVAGVAETDDTFGWSLAVEHFDDDGIHDLVVGVPGEDVGILNAAGAVNVLFGSPSGLTATGSLIFDQDDLPTPQAEANDQFGLSLAVADFDGDGLADIAVGAPGETLGAADFAGSLTVIRGGLHAPTTDGMATFTQSTSGVPDSPEDDDGFATALAAGDFDGDGVADLAIGVPNEDIAVGALDYGVVDVLYGMEGGAFSRLSFDDTTDSESEGKPGLRFLEVRRTGSLRLAASVTVDLVPPSTATAGVDYLFTPATLSWAAGEGGAKFHSYTIVDDGEDEPNETFRVGLTNPSPGAAPGPASGKIVTLVDDDLPSGIFADGFESGDAGSWSAAVP